MMLTNTRDEISSKLGLADMFVLSDFLFQKWLCYGFKYCLIWMKEANLISGAESRLVDLVRSS